MPKSKHRHKAQPIPAQQHAPPMPPASGGLQMQLGYDPKGPSQPIDILSSKDGWSEYTLADGTVIRTKCALLDVKQMVGQYNAEGEPIYVLQMTMINQAKVPDQLKKKG